MVLLGAINNSNRYIIKIYRLELLTAPSNTMLKLLVILFVVKLYARINILIDCENISKRSEAANQPFFY